VPPNSAFRPETQVLHLFTSKCSETLHISFWVQCSRMDASQLWYPEIVHSGPKRKFSYFYMHKICEVLHNSNICHFGSDGVEWMLHNFGALKLCIQTCNTSLASSTCRRLAKCSVTLQTSVWVQWSRMDGLLLWYPEIVHSGPKHKFSSYYMPKVSEVL
jgi:hypothetical protein